MNGNILPGEQASVDLPKPTKKVLQDLVRKMPATEIGILYGVTDKTILRWAASYEIPCPSRGYWKMCAGE